MHVEGIPSVVDKNLGLAFEHLKKAADQGLPKAITKMGHYYYGGIESEDFNLPQNIPRALAFYE